MTAGDTLVLFVTALVMTGFIAGLCKGLVDDEADMPTRIIGQGFCFAIMAGSLVVFAFFRRWLISKGLPL